MFTLFERKKGAELFCDSFEPKCIQKALEDLQKDVEQVWGKKPEMKPYLPYEEEGYLVVGSLENERFREFLQQNHIDVSEIENQWEYYQIQTFGDRDQNLLVCGSDRRGTMWGIYEIAEKYLEIDPVYFWTNQEPVRKSEVQIPKLYYIDGPKTYRYRGWFINDEDFFTQWKEGGGTRYIDYPFYHQVTHPEILEKVIETALRLKVNMMIPASFVDIDNPPEENLVRMVTERGLFISQHHVEPMGVSHFAWERFWEKRGISVETSFVTQKERFEEIWTYYAKKWAQYEGVIWQFGLRGRGDRPVWQHDKNVSSSMKDRGQLISDAIHKQEEIVKKVLGHDQFMSTSTLWMEGATLHGQGYLEFPKKTMVIFSDHGSTQMWEEDFYHVDRRGETLYGVYYHIAFWGAGPHMVQGTSLNKMYYNYGKAVEKGDITYSILNVTNIREVVLGVVANAKLTWDFHGFDPEFFLQTWAKRQFGSQQAAKVYEAFYDAFYKFDSTLLSDHMLLLDGQTKIKGLQMLEMLKLGEEQVSKVFGDEPEKDQEDAFIRQFYKKEFGAQAFASLDTYVEYYKKATKESLSKWEQVYGRAYEALEDILPHRQSYWIEHMVVQCEIMLGLIGWLHHLTGALEERFIAKDFQRCQKECEKAVYAMEKLLMDRKKAEQGKWAHWYRGDKKMDLRTVLQWTKEIGDSFSDKRGEMV